MKVLCLFKPPYRYCTVFILLNLILCCCSNYLKKRQYGYTFTINLYGGQAHPNSTYHNERIKQWSYLCVFSAMFIFHDS